MKTFDERVCDALYKIPRGKVTTYKEIGKYLGTKAYRAVGSAVGRNPDAPKCPCHRVVNSDGRLGGYSAPGGLKTKIKLLKNEGVQVERNSIDLDKYFCKLK